MSHRHEKANNPMVPDYNPDDVNSWLLYVDANKLYGHAMSSFLATCDFRFLTEDEIASFDLSTTSPTDETCYVLEFVLDYPHELHDLQSDYPLAAEKLKITRDKLSPYSESLVGDRFTAQEKLSPNLYDKTKYVTNYENLKFYLEAGMKLKKIHRIMSFTQSDWIRPYIDFNTQKRREATSPYLHTLFKNMNNMLFGKTMEDTRKRLDLHLTKSEDCQEVDCQTNIQEI